MNILKIINIPTQLTLMRLIIAPVVLPLLLVYGLPYNVGWLNTVLAAIFVFFAFTDFLDGYLARKYQQETLFGSELDPIADKFLVYSTLIALLTVNKIYFYWVILLIGRELFVMGLRIIGIEHAIRLQVSFLGKTKTMCQMLVLTSMIANPYQAIGFGMSGMALWNTLESLLLFLTIVLSLESARRYYLFFIHAYARRIPRDDK